MHETISISSYKNAGVDLDAGYESVKRIKPLIDSTWRPGVVGSIGGFGGLFEPDLRCMKRPVTVSGTDGVGTKLRIAQIMDKHDTIGIDCVAMCVNDVVCSGAEPMFFLDYLAMGKNIPQRTESIISGVAEGCRLAGCALIGGETAEHPGVMDDDDYDIAGFAVGLVDYVDIIDGSAIVSGDDIIGLKSSGFHSNGYSLIRKVFKNELDNLGAHVQDLGCTLGEELLRPTRIYVKSLISTIRHFAGVIKGISHITGGGYFENIPRMLPEGILARIETARFPEMPIFGYLASKGGIPESDMFGTFNMGCGIVMVVSADKTGDVMSFLSEIGETPIHLGHCINGEKGVELA